MCSHQPPCPVANGAGRHTAVVVTAHPEQGWSLLCDGTVVFDDTGELLPEGRVVDPHRVPGPPGVERHGVRQTTDARPAGSSSPIG